MIIAVDFDGILADTDVKFPDIGTPNYQMIKLVKSLIDDGNEVVLWTSRTGEALSNALTWCYYKGLDFHAINDNAQSNKKKYQNIYPQGTRKVNADLYIDDHSPDFILDKQKYGSLIAIHNLTKKVKEIIELWKEEN